MSFHLVNYVFFLFTFVVNGGMLFAAIIAIRDRGVGPGLMLTGSAISLVSTSVFHIAMIVSNGRGIPKLMLAVQYANLFTSLGTLLFTAGLILYLLQCRGRKLRIAELETILAAKMAESGHLSGTGFVPADSHTPLPPF